MVGSRTLQVLHLEDDDNDVVLLQRQLAREGVSCSWRVASSREAFTSALDEGGVDVVLSDASVGDLDGISALEMTRQRAPGIPFVFASGRAADARFVTRALSAGAHACFSKIEVPRLAEVLREVSARPDHARLREADRWSAGLERLVGAIQRLANARNLDDVAAVVRRAARELTGADGATFVLRDGDSAHYVDEDAVGPLWKGRRFPLKDCVSGWVVLQRRRAVIEDVYLDPRVPHEAYRATFVRSMAMVPIRILDPVGAIGVYWAERRVATPEEIKLLQLLADSVAVTLECVQRDAGLEQRARDRTAELIEANRELENFTATVAHDLRAPLRHMAGFARILAEDHAGGLDETAQQHLSRIVAGSVRMSQLLEALLAMTHTTQSMVMRQPVDVGAIAHDVVAGLRRADPDRKVDVTIADGLRVHADPRLLRAALECLLGNAWKFSASRTDAAIEVGARVANGRIEHFVRDNGVGFDMAQGDRLFKVFQRLHADVDFPGLGTGLATVRRIVHKHRGEVWAEGRVGAGATVWFWLPGREQVEVGLRGDGGEPSSAMH